MVVFLQVCVVAVHVMKIECWQESLLGYSATSINSWEMLTYLEGPKILLVAGVAKQFDMIRGSVCQCRAAKKDSWHSYCVHIGNYKKPKSTI